MASDAPLKTPLTDTDLGMFRMLNAEAISNSPSLRMIIEQAEEANQLREANQALGVRNVKLTQALQFTASYLAQIDHYSDRYAEWMALISGTDRPSRNTVNIFERSVLQDWVHRLPFMQQSVLIAAVRGPDGIRKDHVVKVLCRYLRRSFMICAFDGSTKWDPYEPGGGSFTGPLKLNGLGPDEGHLDKFVGVYLRHVDELPHHFQLHLMHAAEILGYKHPDKDVRGFWYAFYLAVVKDAHLRPELREDMDRRLGDREETWREGEVVIAEGSGTTAAPKS